MIDKPPGDRTLNLPTPRQAVEATLIVVAILLGLWMLWRFRFVALAIIAAAFLHVGMKPAVAALQRRGMRRAAGVSIVYALLLVAVVGFLLVLAPMLSAQVGKFTAELPDYYRLVRNGMLTSDIDLLTRIARLLPPGGDTAALQSVLMQTISSDATRATSPWPWLGRIGEGLFFAAAVLAMAFHMTLDRELLVYRFALQLPARQREGARELIAELEAKIGGFIRGQLILCAIIGGLSLIAYLLIGLPYALALAAVAFVFEAVPMVGPALTAIVAGIVASSVGPDKLMWTLAAGLVIQAAENNIIVPRVMDKVVGVNPIVTLLSITTFTLLFGIFGALLAIPLAAMIQVFIDRFVFKADTAAEEQGLEAEANAPDLAGGRARIDVLRADALELANDVRKQLRTSDVPTSPHVASLEDIIEQTALDISVLLGSVAGPPATGVASSSAPAAAQKVEELP